MGQGHVAGQQRPSAALAVTSLSPWAWHCPAAPGRRLCPANPACPSLRTKLARDTSAALPVTILARVIWKRGREKEGTRRRRKKEKGRRRREEGRRRREVGKIAKLREL